MDALKEVARVLLGVAMMYGGISVAFSGILGSGPLGFLGGLVFGVIAVCGFAFSLAAAAGDYN